jgi:RNA polymerase sigma-70 factor (ECF subfamily)
MVNLDSNQSSPDDELVVQAIRGDKEAFGDLYERYLDQVYRYVYYRVADQNEAEDLTEQIFLKAWEGLPKAENGLNNFRAWLFRIGHNLVIDHYRTRKQTLSLDQAQSMPDPGWSPESQLQANEQSQHLAFSIQQLDPGLQQVLVCRFINGLNHAETAQIMGLSVGHVRVLQHRALKQIRKYWEGRTER